MTRTTVTRRTFNGLALGSLAAGMAARPARAAAYPDHPLDLVVPFAAGSGTDGIARTVGAKLGQALGQNVVVENKAGASTVIGTSSVIAAKPDGYTLLLGSNTLVLNPTMQKNLPYDTLKDLIPVSPISKQTFAFTISSKVQADTLQDFIALAKASPGKLVYGIAGVGSGNHLTGLLFANMAGVRFDYIPYSDFGQRLSAEINGYVHVSMMTFSEAQPAITAGTVRVLGTSGTTREPALPNVPTIAEAGVPGYAVSEWEGILVRAGTPPDIVNSLNMALGKAVQDPDLVKQFAAAGITPDHSSPEEFKKFLGEEIAKWSDVITKAGLKTG